MGLICEYFLAPSDEAAAATADRVGGPGRPDEPAPARRRGLFRRAAPADVSPGPEAPIYPTVDGGGVEPIVELGQLEALLTGQPADTVLDVNAASGILAERRGGGLLVVRVSDALVAVLADASAEELVAVARPWSRSRSSAACATRARPPTGSASSRTSPARDETGARPCTAGSRCSGGMTRHVLRLAGSRTVRCGALARASWSS